MCPDSDFDKTTVVYCIFGRFVPTAAKNAELKSYIVLQGTGSTSKWNLSCYSARDFQAVLFGFRSFMHGGGLDSGNSDLIPLPTNAGKR